MPIESLRYDVFRKASFIFLFTATLVPYVIKSMLRAFSNGSFGDCDANKIIVAQYSFERSCMRNNAEFNTRTDVILSSS